ncbi:MAG: hypothetical protein RMJ97_12410, partial [Raineya sp.]|nr:hypothetical protein [Raineya sp.]
KNYYFEVVRELGELLVKGEEKNIRSFEGIKWSEIKTYPIPYSNQTDIFCNEILIVGKILPNAQIEITIVKGAIFVTYIKNKTIELSED